MVNKRFQFSGHETFPLRQLWLYKAVHFSMDAKAKGEVPSFAGESAMVQLGVGKNMLSSMRFWAVQSGFLDPNNKFYPTNLAEMIFGDGKETGSDPFGESLVTSWIVHWNLCSSSAKLTAFWFLFNKINEQNISREDFTRRLANFAEENEEKVSINTIRRDVEVCLRSYAPAMSGRIKGLNEEFIEPLLGDLGIVKSTSRDQVDISRGRVSLPNTLFVWAILDMWEKTPELSTLNSLDWFSVAYRVGSPGRVFRLSEQDLYDRLEEIDSLTDGALAWVDQLGIKNIVRYSQSHNELTNLKKHLLRTAYRRS